MSWGWSSVAWAVAVFLLGELIAFPVFEKMKRHYLGPGARSQRKLATLKGNLERITLYTGLLAGFPQVIIAFAALKLGTRLHEEEDSEISNNYFLVGNLSSLLIAVLDALVARQFAF